MKRKKPSIARNEKTASGVSKLVVFSPSSDPEKSIGHERRPVNTEVNFFRMGAGCNQHKPRKGLCYE
jgi:hypothetical protein